LAQYSPKPSEKHVHSGKLEFHANSNNNREILSQPFIHQNFPELQFTDYKNQLIRLIL